MVKQAEDKISQLLKKHKGFSKTETGKIRCDLTNHEMKNIGELKQYLKGKAYRRALQSNFKANDYSEYLVPHRSDSRFLFCNLTGTKVVNKKSVIEKHINGKKYRKALERLKEQQLKQKQKSQKKQAKQQMNEQQGQELQEQQENEEPEEELQQPQRKVPKKKKISKPMPKPRKAVLNP